MIKAEWLYWLCAAFFLISAVIRLTDRSDRKRYGSAAFWGILAFTFVYGTYVVSGSGSSLVEGVAVLALAGLAGLGFPGKGTENTTSPEERKRFADKYGNKLFIPALLIPLIAVIVAVGLDKVTIGGSLLIEQDMATIVGLGIAAVIALIAAMVLFRQRNPAVPFREGDRLLGHIGWAAILPQFLATLGLLFNDSGVGDAVGKITNAVLPKGVLFFAVVVYCLGMALFTMIMGNAFAAFPVMTAAVGWPVLVQNFHGNPAAVFAIGCWPAFAARCARRWPRTSTWCPQRCWSSRTSTARSRRRSRPRFHCGSATSP